MAQKRDFFQAADGRMASLYTLTAGDDFSVDITDMGGALVALRTPDRTGKPVDILLGYNDPHSYEANPSFLGALIGRVSNRIAGGRFALNGREYALECNDAPRPNALHGVKSYGRRLWNASMPDASTLVLSLVSPDGDAGFPGEVKVTVCYHVASNHSLELAYEAETDAPTIVAMTNHAYFNLNGGSSRRFAGQVLYSVAAGRTEVDENLIPTGRIIPLAGTPYNLSAGLSFEKICDNPALPIGFDDNFVLSEQPGTFREKVCWAKSEETGITLEMDTDQPGVQIYTGYWLKGDSTPGKGGRPYGAFDGFCLEAQLWPDAVNHAHFPSPVLNPGERYSQRTIYHFGIA